MSNTSNDVVNSPNHYTRGRFETIEVIKDMLTPDQFKGYCLGNVIKYIARHEYKNGAEDLQKAQVYLNWAAETGIEIEQDLLPVKAEVSL